MALMQRHFKSGLGKRWWEWRALADRRDGREPSYVPPEEEPDDPPVGDPEPPVDTPEDPDTGNPEPGVDPDFVEPTRIDLEDGKQTVVRTEAEPNTWGNAYVGTPADGMDYWEVHVDPSTPVNATLAIGITNLDMPLNGIPGELAGTAAYWSTGVVRSNATNTIGFATYARRDKIMIARDHVPGRIWFGKDGVWLGSTPVVAAAGHQATLTGDGPYYPFVALYSSGAKITFRFVVSKFTYTVPTGFYPLGKTPPTLSSATDAEDGATAADLAVSTTGDDGTLYWVVTTSSTTPTKAQVKAGQDHAGAAAADSGSQAVTVTGAQVAAAADLAAETAYFAHFMHENAIGAQSAVVSGDGFTTGAAGIDFSFIEGKTSTSTTIAANFGAADAGRYVLVSIAAGHGSASNSTLTAVTIGGVAATEVFRNHPGTTLYVGVSFWVALVPTGTSGNVVITGSFNRYTLGVYRLVGLLSTTAHDTDSKVTSTGNGALSIDIPAGGVAFVCSVQAATTAFTWTVTSNDHGASAGGLHRGAHGSFQSIAGQTIAPDVSINASSNPYAGCSLR